MGRAPGEVAARLDGLAARHDFVLSGSRRLHQEVREAVLLFLLDPLERPAVREMNTRAAAHYRARAASADHPTIDAQVTDQRWQTAVISLLWHIFWTDLDQGLETLSRLLPPPSPWTRPSRERCCAWQRSSRPPVRLTASA